MLRKIIYGSCWLLCCCWSVSLFAQQNDCRPNNEQQVVTQGEVVFDYGATTNALDTRRRTRSDIIIGQPVTGRTFGRDNIVEYGFYSRRLLPPTPTVLTATQGELLDRIQLNWEVDPLSPAVTGGFNIYRDGIFLATVGKEISTFNDFNVIAGRPYNYEVRGLNVYGEGVPGKALGFQVPNGTVTGIIQTVSGSPVPNALVTLTPEQGFSARFGATDGAYADTTGTGKTSLLPENNHWSITFWMQTADDSIDAAGTIFQLHPADLAIRPLASGAGVSVSISGAQQLTATFPNELATDWHHLGLTYDGRQLKLYRDGELVDLSPSAAANNSFSDVTELRFGAAGREGWNGRLDEFRIYSRILDELDFDNVKNGTASTITPDLETYWKMDEAQGTKSFDLMNRNILYFCGANFDEERPPVRIAGITNEEGYYRIDAASYGTGTTFLAHPSKNFYKQRALQFRKEERDYALLPDFSITEKATLELWINTAGPDGEQCVLSKNWQNNQFQVRLQPDDVDNDVLVNINGTTTTLGQLGMGYQHLAFTIDQSSNQLQAYKNGEAFGSMVSLPNDYDNFSDSTDVQSWFVGACAQGADTIDYFGGLVAEIAVYDDVLSQADIQSHVNENRDPQEEGLRVYFPFNEGSGNRLNNMGSVLLDRGHPFGASWSNFAPNQETTPHDLTPNSRQVTLNPSVTSVDQVDFVDRSTVPVSGFVRFKDTDCFANQVEILVNGESHNPPIYTDSTGRFVIDFDPGETAVLTPKFENHQFLPASWEVINVANPIAGVLFNDVTTRTVEGQLAGGECKKSIIKAPPGEGQGTVAIVKLRSTDGCYEKQITIDNQEGNYKFENVPPLDELTVAVIEHSDPEVKASFETAGGVTIDLTERDTIVDFTFFAKPEVQLASSQFAPFSDDCSTIVLDQGQNVTLNIKLVENYEPYSGLEGEVCPIDTAAFSIINGIGDETIDTTMSGGMLEYEFKVGVPNASPPYLKTIQVIGTTLADRSGDVTEQAVVQGLFTKLPTFTTLNPSVVSLILRDPPGDGSYAYIEQDSMVCTSVSFGYEDNTQVGGGVEVSLGGDSRIVAAPLGAGTIIETDATSDAEVKAVYTYTKVEDNTLQTCMSFNHRIQTSDGDDYVGADADLFMGSALDLKYGRADKVVFNEATCMAGSEEITVIEPGQKPTTFIYSQTYIKNYVITSLQDIANDGQTSEELKDSCLTAINLWNGYLKDNENQKQAGVSMGTGQFDHVSFDANNTLEYSMAIDTVKSDFDEDGNAYDADLTVNLGFSISGIGLKATAIGHQGQRWTSSDTEEKSWGKTTGFVLADDDANDAFSVEILQDKTYQTPVFKLFAGQSSCPWEAGTANREQPNLQLAEGGSFVANNVLSNEKAVFQLQLGNLSATNEDMTYGLTVVPGSNEDGAVVSVNGTNLNGGTLRYFLPFGESTKATLTLERGPYAYEYDSIQIGLFSMCEYELDLALGRDPRPEFFKSIYLGANFIQPCSEVEINVPQQNFVVRNDDPAQPGTIRRITASGYDTNVPDFQLVRLQYRRTNGDGAWINMPVAEGGFFEAYNPNWAGFNGRGREDIGSDTILLEPSFTQFLWETNGLGDGDYEIHAVAVCTGDATDKPGFSEIIKGRIDRQPPSLIGRPQPSDGVYHVGDEISFTFNKHINCEKLIPADQTQPNNVGLYDATTGQLIDISVTCFENKIIIDPRFENKFFENKILRIELHDIEDLTGNVLEQTKWEFYVDRNELAWLRKDIQETKYLNEEGTITAKIHNRGGYPVPFSLREVPIWLHAVPDTGVLVANEIREIRFEIDPTLGIDTWMDTVVLHTATGENPFFMGGDEHLPVSIRVLHSPPDWTMNESDFIFNTTIIGQVGINFQPSDDEEDQLAVFVNDEVRGVANVTFDEGAGKPLVFLDFFHDFIEESDVVEFKIWDASEGQLLTPLLSLPIDSLICNEDQLLENCEKSFGTISDPIQFFTNSRLQQSYEIAAGWNWISFPLSSKSLDSLNTTFDFKINDFIDYNDENSPFYKNDAVLISKGYKADEIYADDNYELLEWRGYLTENKLGLNRQELYRVQVEQPINFRYEGRFNANDIETITIQSGWNWIGYIAQRGMDVNTALASLNPSLGDVIKGQRTFAVYEGANIGWSGTLTHLDVGKGYMLLSETGGTLNYPDADNITTPPVAKSLVDKQQQLIELEQTVQVQPMQHPNNMSIIGQIVNCEQDWSSEELYVAAYVGTECRGIVPVERVGKQLRVYLTIHGHTQESVRFELLSDQQRIAIKRTLSFEPDGLFGTLAQPYAFEVVVPCEKDEVEMRSGAKSSAIKVYPNPFNDQLTIDLFMPTSAHTRITLQDISGRTIAILTDAILEEEQQQILLAEAIGKQLPSGVYLLNIQSDSMNYTEKLIK